jgi:hypothetical protein
MNGSPYRANRLSGLLFRNPMEFDEIQNKKRNTAFDGIRIQLSSGALPQQMVVMLWR